MLKYFLLISLLVLSANCDGVIGRKSERVKALSRAVGAKMRPLAGQSSSLGLVFDPTNNQVVGQQRSNAQTQMTNEFQFVPIARTNPPVIATMNTQQPIQTQSQLQQLVTVQNGQLVTIPQQQQQQTQQQQQLQQQQQQQQQQLQQQQQQVQFEFQEVRMTTPATLTTPSTPVVLTTTVFVPTTTVRPQEQRLLEQQLMEQKRLAEELQRQFERVQQQQQVSRVGQTQTVQQQLPVQQQMPVQQQFQAPAQTSFNQQQPQQLSQREQQQVQQQLQLQQQMIAQQQARVALQQQQQLQAQQQKIAGQSVQTPVQPVATQVQQQLPVQPQMPVQQQLPVQQQMPVQQQFPVQQQLPVQQQMPVQQVQRQQQFFQQQQFVPQFQPVQQPVQQFRQIQASEDFCRNSQPGDLIPHPRSQSQFVICYGFGEFTVMDCPEHLVYNPHLQRCDLDLNEPLLCKSNPCLNNGKCVELNSFEFRCECPAGFSGRNCERIDACAQNPCGPAGQCLTLQAGSPTAHACLCNGGRSIGQNCQQVEQNPCLQPNSNLRMFSTNLGPSVFAHCEGARPHFKFCQAPLIFNAAKQSCDWL